MGNRTFIEQIASVLLLEYSDKLTETIIVLPNRRAKVFLMESLKKQTTKTTFSPEIISIEDLIQNISNIRSIDSVELLFEFYTVYLELTEKNPETFDSFDNLLFFFHFLYLQFSNWKIDFRY